MLVNLYNISGPTVIVSASISRAISKYTATLRKIGSFSRLPVSWHYGQGGPIERTTIDRAIELWWFMRLNGFASTDAFPGANGEIQLTGYHGHHFIGIMIEPNGEYSLVHEIDHVDAREPIESITDVQQIKTALKEIADEITGESTWNTSATFTLRTLTPNENVLPRSLSKNPVLTAAHQSSSDSASNTAA